jgi:hypothetical protein
MSIKGLKRPYTFLGRWVILALTQTLGKVEAFIKGR